MRDVFDVTSSACNPVCAVRLERPDVEAARRTVIRNVGEIIISLEVKNPDRNVTQRVVITLQDQDDVITWCNFAVPLCPETMISEKTHDKRTHLPSGVK